MSLLPQETDQQISLRSPALYREDLSDIESIIQKSGIAKRVIIEIAGKGVQSGSKFGSISDVLASIPTNARIKLLSIWIITTSDTKICIHVEKRSPGAYIYIDRTDRISMPLFASLHERLRQTERKGRGAFYGIILTVSSTIVILIGYMPGVLEGDLGLEGSVLLAGLLALFLQSLVITRGYFALATLKSRPNAQHKQPYKNPNFLLSATVFAIILAATISLIF